MATVTITGASRRGDDVFVAGTVDGTPVRAHLWWSHLAPLTVAQRRIVVAQALVAEAEAQASTDLGITGTLTV